MDQQNMVINQHGGFINYRQTEDKRVIFKWIDEEVKKKGISGPEKQKIDSIIDNCIILNIPVKERRKDPYSCYSKLKYDELWEILGICRATIYDFLRGVGVNVPELFPEGVDADKKEYNDRRRYLPKDVSDLYRICDSLPEEDRKKLLLTAKSMSPVFWQSVVDDGFAITDENEFIAFRDPKNSKTGKFEKERVTWKTKRFHGNPSKRIYWLVRRKEMKTSKKGENTNSWGGEEWAVKLYNRVSDGKEWEKPIHLEDLPDAAVCLNVSLHNLFGAPDTLFLYATKPYTETIISAYYFMSQESKKLFFEIAADWGEFYEY